MCTAMSFDSSVELVNTMGIQIDPLIMTFRYIRFTFSPSLDAHLRKMLAWFPSLDFGVFQGALAVGSDSVELSAAMILSFSTQC